MSQGQIRRSISEADFARPSLSPGRIPARHAFRQLIGSDALAMVENSSVPQDVSPSGYNSNLQIVLPYAGLFAYSVGRRRMLVDSNQIMLVGEREEYKDEHPLRDLGHAAIVITPAKWLVDDVSGEQKTPKIGRYATSLVPASRQTRILAHRLATADQPTPLERDERMVSALREALIGGPRKTRRSPRHVERAKQLLHEFPLGRLSLDEIAREVELSPVYLTQLFNQAEGMPLYQYQLHLRLNRALLALPRCEDIGQLAIDLGFSSHSHFSAVFRATFGVTPSAYRTELSTRVPRAGLGDRPSWCRGDSDARDRHDHKQ